MRHVKFQLNPASRNPQCTIRIRCHILHIALMVVLITVGCASDDNSLQQIEEHIRSGMYTEAISLLEEAIAQDNRKPKVYDLLGEAYEGLGQYDEAIAHWKIAINLYSAQPERRVQVRLQLAKTYLKLGDRRAEFNELRAIVRSTSDNLILQEVGGLLGDSYKVVKLTQGEKDSYSPAFSPDGMQIAFAAYRLDNGDIYLMNLKGRILQRVTFTADFNESSPVFLSNPYYLLYSREPRTTREVKLLLQSSGSTKTYAGFSVTHIYSKVTQELLPVGFGVRAPCVSADRRRVVYESNNEGNLELYSLDLSEIDLETTDSNAIEPKPITHNEVDDGSPSFFPDGQRIAFVSSRGHWRERVHQIYTINVDGSHERHLNPNPYDCYSPVVSSDGSVIVFVSARDGDMEIYMINADGTNERRITNGIGVSMQPALSPDGTKLAFVSDRSDVFQIYLMDFAQPITRKALMQRLKEG
jgi:Tol biopolymer transport system component